MKYEININKDKSATSIDVDVSDDCRIGLSIDDPGLIFDPKNYIYITGRDKNGDSVRLTVYLSKYRLNSLTQIIAHGLKETEPTT